MNGREQSKRSATNGGHVMPRHRLAKKRPERRPPARPTQVKMAVLRRIAAALERLDTATGYHVLGQAIRASGQTDGDLAESRPSTNRSSGSFLATAAQPRFSEVLEEWLFDEQDYSGDK
jgi:hypothetical protein